MPTASASRLRAAQSSVSTRPRLSLRSYRAPVNESAAVEADLERIALVVERRAGCTIIEQGDPSTNVFRVIAGLLRAVLLLPDGRRYVVRFVWPGDFFGFGTSNRYIQTVEAIGPVKLLRYGRAHVDALMATNSRAGYQLLGRVSDELLSAQDHLLLLGRKTALERVATFLLEMAGRRTDPTQVIGREACLPMNRMDIADYLGLTIETVSRLMTLLKQRRIIALPSADRVTILNPVALDRFAGCKTKALRP